MGVGAYFATTAARASLRHNTGESREVRTFGAVTGADCYATLNRLHEAGEHDDNDGFWLIAV